MERCLFPLTGVRIGLWTPHSAWSAFLLTLPASQRFVVLLTRNDGRRVRARARAVLSTACVLMCCCDCLRLASTTDHHCTCECTSL